MHDKTNKQTGPIIRLCQYTLRRAWFITPTWRQIWNWSYLIQIEFITRVFWGQIHPPPPQQKKNKKIPSMRRRTPPPPPPWGALGFLLYNIVGVPPRAPKREARNGPNGGISSKRETLNRGLCYYTVRGLYYGDVSKLGVWVYHENGNRWSPAVKNKRSRHCGTHPYYMWLSGVSPPPPPPPKWCPILDLLSLKSRVNNSLHLWSEEISLVEEWISLDSNSSRVKFTTQWVESRPGHSIFTPKEVITDVTVQGVKTEWKFTLFLESNYKIL